MRGLILFVVAVAGMASCPAHAQDANTIKSQNWDKIATVSARFLAQAHGVQLHSAIFGSLSDLNFDGSAELFIYTDPSNCVPEECGTSVFGLIGKEFVELPEIPDTLKHTPVNQVSFPAQKRNGYVDITYGRTVLTFNGSRYVDGATMPVGKFNTKTLQTACEKDSESDYSFQTYQIDQKKGRKTICSCMSQRFMALGFDQAAADKAIKHLTSYDHPDSNGTDEDFAVNRLDEVTDARNGCMIQNGWSQWTYNLGTSDEKENQSPLDYSQFIPKCASQDWLSGNSKVGSGDRALSLCGCVARKLSARGWDQLSLDGVAQLYAGDIDEDALSQVRSDAPDVSDTDLDTCLGELPALESAK